MRVYETTIVIDSTMKADDIRHLRDKTVNFISNHGGNIVKLEEWGKRRLAYEINKKQYGFYLHIRFSAPQAVPVLLEREYRLNESVLRYLTVKLDRRALKSDEEKARLAAKAMDEAEDWDIVSNLGAEDDEEPEAIPKR